MTLRGLAVSLGVAAVFLGMATIISVLAPVHMLTLRRQAPQVVSADISQLVLLVIPIRGKTVSGVTGVRTRMYAAAPDPRAAVNPADVVRPELQGFLALEADGPGVDIPASPSDVEAVERSVRAFLDGRDSALRVRLVSNWKIGVVAVIFVALPGLLVLAGAARDAAAWRPRRH